MIPPWATWVATSSPTRRSTRRMLWCPDDEITWLTDPANPVGCWVCGQPGTTDGDTVPKGCGEWRQPMRPNHTATPPVL